MTNESEKRDRFNQWFSKLLRTQKDCIERDVLRATKEALWVSWKKWVLEE